MQELIKQYAKLHQTRRYGISSLGNYHFLLPHIREIAPRSIIDFGCGQSRLPDALSKTLGVPVRRYDPAIEEYAKRPDEQFDLLINIDVLEHVPEQEVASLIGEMAALSRNAIIIIDTVPAKTILPDGRNAHVTLRPAAWWREQLAAAYADVEPIRARSRRRAAFKTWTSAPWRRYLNVASRPFDYLRYRAIKWRATHS